MAVHDRLQLVRDCYGAYASGFTFYSPADVGIDRGRYFVREHEDRWEPVSQRRGPHLQGNKICRAEVYFGWDLE